MTQKIPRRAFSAAAAASLIGTSRAWAGANDRIRVAVIGMGGRGGTLMRQASALPNVEVVTVCDPDVRRMAEWASVHEKERGARPKEEPDLRRIMDDKSIDAVTIACSNHWHAPAGIWACQAGKHAYVEKPVSHDIWEGRRLVQAARRHQRCVQGGTQWNSSGHMRKAIQLLHEGVIGKLYKVRAVLHGKRDSIGFRQPEAPPSWLHWDLWLGPSPDQPFHANLVHYNWHWFWDFGNGEMGNNGSHLLNVARWGLGRGLPSRILSAGGRFGYQDQAETPNTLTTTFEYDDGVSIICEITGLHTPEDPGWSWHFYGSEGYMFLTPSRVCRIYLGRSTQPEPDPGRLEEINHYGNFVDAIRAGKPEMLTAEIEQLHLSCALCHLGNISYRLKRRLHFDPRTERFLGDQEADTLLRRNYRPPFLISES